jgi:hypothetical protein
MKLLLAVLVSIAAAACVSALPKGAHPPTTSSSTSALSGGSADCSVSTSPGITCIFK